MATIKVLLADDDEDDKEMFQEIMGLREEMELIKTVSNGQEVIDYLESASPEQIPDLIILDHNMPKLNGKQTLVYLKGSKDLKEIPVILYSTYSDNHLEEEGRKLGVQHIATKPNSFSEYKKMIDIFLRIAQKKPI